MAEPAFLFPGQGSQRVGMGGDLRGSHPEVFGRWFELADRISGLPVSTYALEGPLDALTDTKVAQPAIFTLSMAVAEVASGLGLRPAAVAGHSLGEYTAAVAAGALSGEEGVRLVCERGRLMSAAQERIPGTMAAVIGLAPDQVAELCQAAAASGTVVVANLNSDSQVVVSGEVSAVERVIELAPAAGADSATRLQVGAAFHSPLMRPVQEELARSMERLDWRDLSVPLYANHDARPVRGATDVRTALVTQIASPVRWADCVRALRADGTYSVLELGPGRVLTGLSRMVDPDIDAFAADSAAKLQRYLETHEEAGRG